VKLRNKVLISISIVWIIFLALTYFNSKFFLLRSFIQVELARTDRNLGRIDQALDQNNNALYTFTSDWAHWDDLYAYMQGKKPDFIPGNINMTAFQNSTVNFMTFWDVNGKLMMGTAVDTDNGKFIAYPKKLQDFLYPNSKLLSRKDLNKDLRGYVLLPGGVMEVVAIGISNGDKTMPSLGAMVTGRWLSPLILKKIADQTKLNVELILPHQLQSDSHLNDIFKTISENKTGHSSENIDDDNLYGYSVIRDIDDHPIAMFRMKDTRSVYKTGVEAVRYYLTSFAILAVAFSLLMIWLLRQLVVRRLEKLNRDVSEISETNSLSRRVDTSGNDELSTVSAEINHMLSLIEASQEKLEQRVEQRTEELKTTNVKLEQEITERKSVEKELIIHKEHLAHLAHYDSLTSLPNRVLFNGSLNKAIEHANRHNKKLAILFIDLDRFKNVNDAFGHPTGDRLLKEIAQRFTAALRTGDILSRFGGDEFIILLPNIQNQDQINPVAEKLIETCANPVWIDNRDFFITASIGICIYPDDGTSLEELQKNADMAMYRAKRSGGGVLQYFTSEMNTEAHEHAQLETALRKAIQKGDEFVLHYQPKLDVKQGTITGAEALIRWESPELGFISPAKFIPLAEESGLIMAIGEWTLREACRASHAWQKAGYPPIKVAVNLSPKQFRHQDVPKLVKGILAETGLDAKWLELEITETAVMDNVDTGINTMLEICNMGVSIAMDDFGTGYTSISYLKRFPVSVLKVDQSFIKELPQNRDDMAIVTGIIALAHSLSMKVVAEGVETAEQMQFLADNECDIVQGYYLSRPLPEGKFLMQLTSDETTVENTV